MSPKRKYSAISVHETISGTLKVNWEQEYKGEFICPHCLVERLTNFQRNKKKTCQLYFRCKHCRKYTSLSNQIAGTGRTHFPISEHQTLTGTLKVNWHQEYKGEFNCPSCNQGQITRYKRAHSQICKLVLNCNSCYRKTSLTCPVPIYVFNYRPEIECPNFLCTNIGHNGQKGWVYFKTKNNYRCHFCQINFNPNSTSCMSWVNSQTEEKLSPFAFDEDIWQLGHFYKHPHRKTINFQTIYPVWYRQKVKKYLDYLLKSQVYSSSSRINYITNTLRHFGKSITAMKIKRLNEIERSTITHFLDNCKSNSHKTINDKLAQLRDFFDWLDLETPYLIRSRDFLKASKNDANWLDEVTRQAIEQHLDKIPAPIASQYLVQSYIAARPGDMCRLPFDCLVEENGKWYIKFFQSKTQRWHKIFASRKIRKIIEEQQQWIRKNLGQEYTFLFCHFRSIKEASYPTFPNIKPLLKPPVETHCNSMVRVIRMLIDKENVLDVNGKKPDFTAKILRSSRLQEVRTNYGMEAAQLYADHKNSTTTFQNYAPPTREQIAKVDLPFQELLLNPDNKFLPWQTLPESLLKNPKAHELDLEITPRLVVYGHCSLNPKTPCPVNLFPKCYGCSSFRPSTNKLPLYERQYQGEQQRLTEAEKAGAELAHEEARSTIEAMDKWLPELTCIIHERIEKKPESLIQSQA